MLDLKPHQLKAVEKLSNGRILWGGTGSGKTHTAVGYYEKKEAPKDVYVITTARKRDSLDWEKTFARIGVGKSADATVAGVLRVDSWNNIGKYRDVKGAFFIFDEQRLVGAGEWSDAFLKIAKTNGWILLTATPGDSWMDYIPVFVANGFYKNRTEFKRDHVVYVPYTKFPKVDRYIGTGKLLKLRNELLVEMPYLWHTTRQSETVDVGFDVPLFEKVLKQRWNPYENRPLRDVAELFLVMRKVVNSDGSRLEAVRQLLTKHPRLIVFYNFNYELEALRNLFTNEPTISLQVPIVGIPSEESQELTGKWESKDSITSKKNVAGFSTNLESTSSTMSLNGIEKNSSEQLPRISDSSNLSERTTEKTSSSHTQENNELWQTQKPVGIESSEMENSSSSVLVAAKNSTLASLKKKSMITTKNMASGSTSLQVAEWNGHKHQPVPETERWVYLVQFAAGAEAWNCTTTDAMCFYSLPYSYKFWHQAHGRIDRLDTPFSILHYYILKSRSFIDLEIAKSLANKQDFNESRFITSRARVDESGQGR